MSYNILFIIVIALLTLFLICYYRVKENFENNAPNNNISNSESNNVNNNVSNTGINTEYNNISNTGSNSGYNDVNNSMNIYKNAAISMGTGDYYQLNFKNTDISTQEIETNLDFKMPEMILDYVGARRLIVHWQSEVPSGYSIMKYNINVYKCNGLELCNTSDAEEIKTFDVPSPRCKSCYLIINNMDMSTYTYMVKLQIVYQNIATGQLVTGPTDMKTTVREVEQDLSKMYKNVLDHLIDENIKQKKIDMEQHLQKMKIDELRDKIMEMKSKLLKSEKYAKNISEMSKPPFPIKTYYSGVNFMDANKPTQQSIKFGDKEYYIGLVVN